MSKLKVIWYKVFDVLDDILAYILTIIGILASNYLPDLAQKGEIRVEIGWWRVGLAAIVAFMVIARQESLESNQEGSTVKAREGRRKNFKARMGNALAHGFMFAQIMQIPPG